MVCAAPRERLLVIMDWGYALGSRRHTLTLSPCASISPSCCSMRRIVPRTGRLNISSISSLYRSVVSAGRQELVGAHGTWDGGCLPCYLKLPIVDVVLVAVLFADAFGQVDEIRLGLVIGVGAPVEQGLDVLELFHHGQLAGPPHGVCPAPVLLISARRGRELRMVYRPEPLEQKLVAIVVIHIGRAASVTGDLGDSSDTEVGI